MIFTEWLIFVKHVSLSFLNFCPLFPPVWGGCLFQCQLYWVLLFMWQIKMWNLKQISEWWQATWMCMDVLGMAGSGWVPGGPLTHMGIGTRMMVPSTSGFSLRLLSLRARAAAAVTWGSIKARGGGASVLMATSWSALTCIDIACRLFTPPPQPSMQKRQEAGGPLSGFDLRQMGGTGYHLLTDGRA